METHLVSVQKHVNRDAVKLTGVEEDEELQTGHLSSVHLQQLQSHGQLLSSLHHTGQRRSSIRHGRQIHLQHTAPSLHSHTNIFCFSSKNDGNTHLLSCDEQQTIVSPMMHLSADMIEKQQLTPAVMQQSHLISYLNHKEKWSVIACLQYFFLLHNILI